MPRSLARLHIHLFKDTVMCLMSGMCGIDRWFYDGSTVQPGGLPLQGAVFFIHNSQGDALGCLSLPRWGVGGWRL